MTLLQRLLFAFCLLGILVPAAHAAEAFPHRAIYLAVPWIETEDLYQRRDQFNIIDVRTSYEFETLHINGALNIPVEEYGFVDALKKVRQEDARPIAVYCNGHTCKKSYEAAQKALEGGVEQVYAYDAGIFEWTVAHPNEATLLGKSPVDTARLIPKEKFEAHLLPPADFLAQMKTGGIVLDVRDASQRADTLSVFPMYQRSVSLDNAQLKSFVDQAKKENKTLYIFDAVGKQVEWLQYYLEDQGVAHYYFLKGGARGYFEYLQKR